MAGEGAGAERGEHVVEGDAGAHVDPLPDPPGERVEEGHGPGEVRAEAVDHEVALVERLGDQAQLELLQVAEAAVEQLRGAAGGAGGEVALLDEGDREPAGGGVERHTGAGDATTDHDEVEHLVPHAAEVVFALVAVQRLHRVDSVHRVFLPAVPDPAVGAVDGHREESSGPAPNSEP